MIGYRFSVLLNVVLLLFISGCSSDSEDYKSYTGRFIQLDFSEARTIENEHWIEIDGVKYIHYDDLDVVYNEPFGLYASEIGFKEAGSNKLEPVNGHSIALMLISKLEATDLNLRKMENVRTQNRVYAEHDLLLYGSSIMRLRAENGVRFTIKTHPDYPVPIEVLE